MKKLKIAVICLSILFILSVLYGVMTTFVIREALIESSMWETKYNEVVDDYKELSEKYQNGVLNDIRSLPIVLDATARCIDDKAKVGIVDKVVYMYVPYSSDVKSKIESYAWSIPSALKNDNYSSCIITVIDDMGKCVYGWTILPNSDTYAFVSK